MSFLSRLHTRLGRTSAFVATVLIGALATNVSARAQSNSHDQSITALSGTVTGNVQQVGFRAMIQKQAIEQNLAGTAENNTADGTVLFLLQGDKDRIDKALKKISEGTPKSSNVNVTTHDAPVDSALKNFTVIDWTSKSRGISNKYQLVFDLRSDNTVIDKHEAKAVWLKICEKTVRGEDVGKCDKGNDE